MSREPTGFGYPDSGYTPRGVEEPTTDERGYEHHPSWVTVSAYRGTNSHGKVLFDSDILHRNTVTVKLSRAERKRDLKHDYIHAGQQVIEFTMSEAQWASFVSTMNSGTGVPATLEWDASEENPQIPSEPFSPRLAESLDELRDAAKEAVADVARAMAAYKEKKNVGNLRHLEAMIDNLPANMTFAATSASEHAEKIVERSKADIEAYVIGKAHQLGLDPADLGPLQLGSGDPDES